MLQVGAWFIILSNGKTQESDRENVDYNVGSHSIVNSTKKLRKFFPGYENDLIL